MSNSSGPIWTEVAKARRARGDVDGARQATANAKAAATSNAVNAARGRRSREVQLGLFAVKASA